MFLKQCVCVWGGEDVNLKILLLKFSEVTCIEEYVLQDYEECDTLLIQ